MKDENIRYLEDELRLSVLNPEYDITEWNTFVCFGCGEDFGFPTIQILQTSLETNWVGCQLFTGTPCPSKEAKPEHRRQQLSKRYEEGVHAHNLEVKEINHLQLEFNVYSKRVRRLTESVYRDHKDTINPLELLRGPENYHVDHIVSVRECFRFNVPAELCSHQNNLQMLSSHKNSKKADSSPDTIPPILESFLHQ